MATPRTLRVTRPPMRGSDVRRVQRAVGATVDGDYGTKTAGRVRVFQRRHGITPVSGVTGPRTWAKIAQIEHKQTTGAAALFADLSGHNTDVDLAAYARAGHRTIVLKATEGDHFRSDSFIARWRRAGQLGLQRRAYHFARPSANTPEAEARYFLAFVRKHGLRAADRLVLDWEDPGYHAGRAKGQAWIDRFAKACGPQLDWLYSYGPYLQASALRLGRLRYWHAAYIARPQSTIPNWARSALVAVQFTNGDSGGNPHYLTGCGKLGGRRRCDVNRYA